MLNKIQIQNFRCFKGVHLSLAPLTVLIGPNDTGKTAFLCAIEYLIYGKQFEDTDYWRMDRSSWVSIEGWAPPHHGRIATQIGYGERLVQLAPAIVFRTPSSGPAMESIAASDSKGVPAIAADGGNVASLLDYLLRRDRNRFFAYVDSLRRLIPGLEDVTIFATDKDTRRVDLVIENGLSIPGDKASAGVRLIVFFTALAFHPTPPKVLLIEEPENGVHSKRLADIMNLLREITQGKHGGHRAQVILTTHSPYLLDCVDLKQDQLLVFRRNQDGSRSAEAADESRLRKFLDEFMLGEVWYNQGEEGLVAQQK